MNYMKIESKAERRHEQKIINKINKIQMDKN